MTNNYHDFYIIISNILRLNQFLETKYFQYKLSLDQQTKQTIYLTICSLISLFSKLTKFQYERENDEIKHFIDKMELKIKKCVDLFDFSTFNIHEQINFNDLIILLKTQFKELTTDATLANYEENQTSSLYLSMLIEQIKDEYPDSFDASVKHDIESIHEAVTVINDYAFKLKHNLKTCYKYKLDALVIRQCELFNQWMIDATDTLHLMTRVFDTCLEEMQFLYQQYQHYDTDPSMTYDRYMKDMWFTYILNTETDPKLQELKRASIEEYQPHAILTPNSTQEGHKNYILRQFKTLELDKEDVNALIENDTLFHQLFQTDKFKTSYVMLLNNISELNHEETRLIKDFFMHKFTLSQQHQLQQNDEKIKAQQIKHDALLTQTKTVLLNNLSDLTDHEIELLQTHFRHVLSTFQEKLMDEKTQLIQRKQTEIEQLSETKNGLFRSNLKTMMMNFMDLNTYDTDLLKLFFVDKLTSTQQQTLQQKDQEIDLKQKQIDRLSLSIQKQHADIFQNLTDFTDIELKALKHEFLNHIRTSGMTTTSLPDILKMSTELTNTEIRLVKEFVAKKLLSFQQPTLLPTGSSTPTPLDFRMFMTNLQTLNQIEIDLLKNIYFQKMTSFQQKTIQNYENEIQQLKIENEQWQQQTTDLKTKHDQMKTETSRLETSHMDIILHHLLNYSGVQLDLLKSKYHEKIAIASTNDKALIQFLDDFTEFELNDISTKLVQFLQNIKKSDNDRLVHQFNTFCLNNISQLSDHELESLKSQLVSKITSSQQHQIERYTSQINQLKTDHATFIKEHTTQLLNNLSELKQEEVEILKSHFVQKISDLQQRSIDKKQQELEQLEQQTQIIANHNAHDIIQNLNTFNVHENEVLKHYFQEKWTDMQEMLRALQSENKVLTQTHQTLQLEKEALLSKNQQVPLHIKTLLDNFASLTVQQLEVLRTYFTTSFTKMNQVVEQAQALNITSVSEIIKNINQLDPIEHDLLKTQFFHKLSDVQQEFIQKQTKEMEDLASRHQRLASQNAHQLLSNLNDMSSEDHDILTHYFKTKWLDTQMENNALLHDTHSFPTTLQHLFQNLTTLSTTELIVLQNTFTQHFQHVSKNHTECQTLLDAMQQLVDLELTSAERQLQEVFTKIEETQHPEVQHQFNRLLIKNITTLSQEEIDLLLQRQHQSYQTPQLLPQPSQILPRLHNEIYALLISNLSRLSEVDINNLNSKLLQTVQQSHVSSHDITTVLNNTKQLNKTEIELLTEKIMALYTHQTQFNDFILSNLIQFTQRDLNVLKTKTMDISKHVSHNTQLQQNLSHILMTNLTDQSEHEIKRLHTKIMESVDQFQQTHEATLNELIRVLSLLTDFELNNIQLKLHDFITRDQTQQHVRSIALLFDNVKNYTDTELELYRLKLIELMNKVKQTHDQAFVREVNATLLSNLATLHESELTFIDTHQKKKNEMSVFIVEQLVDFNANELNVLKEHVMHRIQEYNQQHRSSLERHFTRLFDTLIDLEFKHVHDSLTKFIDHQKTQVDLPRQETITNALLENVIEINHLETQLLATQFQQKLRSVQTTMIDKYEKEKEALQKRLNDVSKSIETKQTQLGIHQQNITDLQSKITPLLIENVLQLSDLEIVHLKPILNKKMYNVVGNVKENRSLLMMKLMEEFTTHELNMVHTQLLDFLKHKNEALMTMTTRLNDLISKTSQLETERDQLKKEISTTQTNLKDLTDQLTQHRTRLYPLLLANLLQLNEIELNEIKKNVSRDMTHGIEQMKNNESQLITMLQQLTDDELTLLQTKLNSFIKNRDEQLSLLTSQINDTQTKINETQTNYEKLQTDFDALQTQLDLNKNQTTQLHQQIQPLIMENLLQLTQIEMQHLSVVNKQIHDRVSSLKTETQDLIQLFDTLTDRELQIVQQLISQFMNKRDSELTQVTTQLTDLKTHYQQTEIDNETLKKEVEQLQTQLGEHVTKINELHASVVEDANEPKINKLMKELRTFMITIPVILPHDDCISAYKHQTMTRIQENVSLDLKSVHETRAQNTPLQLNNAGINAFMECVLQFCYNRYKQSQSKINELNLELFYNINYLFSYASRLFQSQFMLYLTCMNSIQVINDTKILQIYDNLFTVLTPEESDLLNSYFINAFITFQPKRYYTFQLISDLYQIIKAQLPDILFNVDYIAHTKIRTFLLNLLGICESIELSIRDEDKSVFQSLLQIYNDNIHEINPVFVYIKERCDSVYVNPRYTFQSRNKVPEYTHIDLTYINSKLQVGFVKMGPKSVFERAKRLTDLGVFYCNENAIESLKNEPKEQYNIGNINAYFNKTDEDVLNKKKGNVVLKYIDTDHPKCIQLLHEQIDRGEDLFIIGYGQSGAGKTTCLIKFKQTETFVPNLLKFHQSQLDGLKHINKLEMIAINIYYTWNPKNDSMDSIHLNDYKLDYLFFHEYAKFKFDIRLNTWVYDGPQIESISPNDRLSDIIDLMFNTRQIEPTENNPNSSRSHILLHFKIPINSKKMSNVIVGDLAGVENVFECDKLTSILNLDSKYTNSSKYKTTPIVFDTNFCIDNRDAIETLINELRPEVTFESNKEDCFKEISSPASQSFYSYFENFYGITTPLENERFKKKPVEIIERLKNRLEDFKQLQLLIDQIHTAYEDPAYIDVHFTTTDTMVYKESSSNTVIYFFDDEKEIFMENNFNYFKKQFDTSLRRKLCENILQYLMDPVHSVSIASYSNILPILQELKSGRKTDEKEENFILRCINNLFNMFNQVKMPLFTLVQPISQETNKKTLTPLITELLTTCNDAFIKYEKRTFPEGNSDKIEMHLVPKYLRHTVRKQLFDLSDMPFFDSVQLDNELRLLGNNTEVLAHQFLVSFLPKCVKKIEQDMIRYQLLVHNCSIRRKEGYFINKSLSDMKKSLSMALNTKLHSKHPVLFNYISPMQSVCHDNYLYRTFDFFNPQPEDLNVLPDEIIFKILQTPLTTNINTNTTIKGFGLDMSRFNLVIFTVINTTGGYAADSSEVEMNTATLDKYKRYKKKENIDQATLMIVNNPPSVPFINLNPMKNTLFLLQTVQEWTSFFALHINTQNDNFLSCNKVKELTLHCLQNSVLFLNNVKNRYLFYKNTSIIVDFINTFQSSTEITLSSTLDDMITQLNQIIVYIGKNNESTLIGTIDFFNFNQLVQLQKYPHRYFLCENDIIFPDSLKAQCSS
uniref:Uncharacterized protein n=1 Tax=viral metagenome TaxID=1070528 RepID=A0A6C0CSR6_9ZZZZ